MTIKKKSRLLVLLGVVAGIMILSAFLFVPRDDASAFKTVFSGFRLAAVADVPPGLDPQSIDISSLQSKYPLIPSLTPGRIYVFDKTTKVSSVTFAKWVLPFRLWRAGAHVTQRANHMLYPFVGGPLYMVQFAKDGNRGYIFNGIKNADNGKIEETLAFVYLSGDDKTALATTKATH